MCAAEEDTLLRKITKHTLKHRGNNVEKERSHIQKTTNNENEEICLFLTRNIILHLSDCIVAPLTIINEVDLF